MFLFFNLCINLTLTQISFSPPPKTVIFSGKGKTYLLQAKLHLQRLCWEKGKVLINQLLL